MSKNKNADIVKELETYIDSLLSVANTVVVNGQQNMRKLYEVLPPSKKLKSIDGLFLVPFVLREWSLNENFEIASKIKVAIAHDIESVLAIAYRMGVNDGSKGKVHMQRINEHRSVDEILFNDIGLDCDKLRQTKSKRIKDNLLLNKGDKIVQET